MIQKVAVNFQMINHLKTYSTSSLLLPKTLNNINKNLAISLKNKKYQ